MIAKGFTENSKIMYVANIFKFKHLKSWNLELCVRSDGQDQVLHTRLSNLPALAKRRVINPSDGQSRKGGYSFSLSDISTSNWQVGTDSEGGGNTFMFDYIRSDESTVTVHTPQIEFARILFFHNAYLARNCIDQGLLSREFWIQDIQDDSILVNILPISSLPIKSFENEGQRRLLAWILLDKNARSSYESIAKNFTEEVQETEDKKIWRFRFSPPRLDNISLETRGWMDKDTDNYYVYEVLGISNIPSSLPKTVRFYSEKFKTGMTGSAKDNGAKSVSSADSNTIDDQQDADIDTKLKTLDIPTTSFSFVNAIETRKVVKKRVASSNGIESEEYEDLVGLDLSADEATIDGTACQTDFSGIDDESEVLELYIQRFEAFKLLIKKLLEQHDLDCHEELHFLPAVGRSSLHRTIDGNKRSLLEVQIKTDKANFIVLEVDMSDNNRMLSTLIIKVEDTELWSQQLEDILQLIVQRSINWPTNKYLENFGIVKRMRHPSNSLQLTDSSIEFNGWLSRLTGILET
ncbi:Tn7-like element transposition protein TnsE [Psychrobacter sp. BF1]|uniref:Tn7-like element transposition protein TnsE n=1 Tax=Psychrobacter sp. BF1 TaxID=2821147 RepID=UPI001C4DDD48|nr:Tn7-like element transposition protein TnsE [Psychrobacter sp. BF1]